MLVRSTIESSGKKFQLVCTCADYHHWDTNNRKTGKSGWAEDTIVFELANGKIIF
jgi:hypothetical protein